MAQQTINVGAVPNDNTGDPIRTAFTKTNANFTELYGGAAGAFSVVSYGAVGDGTTDDYAAVAAALAAIYTAKGGTLVFPYRQAGYKLGTSVVIDVGQYAGGGSIIIDLGGNAILPSHTGWCFDVATNFFGANNAGIFGKKRVFINGGGANITTSNSAASGGVRFTDCVAFTLQDIMIRNYSSGTGVQLNISTNDLSTWVEHGELAYITVLDCLTGIYTKSTNSGGSFLGNTFRNVVAGTNVNNAKLFNLEGLLFDCLFLNCGGYYNQSGATGGNGFYLNGGYCGATFINPYIDVGGTGTQSALTDIVFGPSFTGTTQYQPVLVNVLEIDLPLNWRTKLLVIGPINSTGVLSNYASGNAREVLRSSRTYYVNASTGSDTTKDGLTSGNPFATVAKAISVVYGEIDCAGQDVIIQLADATYTTGITVAGTPVGLGSAFLTIQGTSSAGAVISATSADALTVTSGARVKIGNMRLQTTTSGNGMNVDLNSYCQINPGVEIGACATRGMFANTGGVINQASAITWTGNGPIGIGLAAGSKYIKSAAITNSGRTFSDTFAKVGEQSVMSVNESTFTKVTVTGSSYYAFAGGLIQTFGQANTLFTGTAGFAEAGQFAQYL